MPALIASQDLARAIVGLISTRRHLAQHRHALARAHRPGAHNAAMTTPRRVTINGALKRRQTRSLLMAPRMLFVLAKNKGQS